MNAGTITAKNDGMSGAIGTRKSIVARTTARFSRCY
jgi:hypothetical protein